MITLKGEHLWISADFVAEVFQNEEHVNWVYYPDRQQLLLARRSLAFFQKMHKTNWLTLKVRNLQGDRTLDIRLILLDNELDTSQLQLAYEVQASGLVKINFIQQPAA